MTEGEVNFGGPVTNSLTAILESAAEFGLTPDEISETVIAALDRLPADTKAPWFDELAGALAKRLLENQPRYPSPHTPARKS
jgi:hypothetical protein